MGNFAYIKGSLAGWANNTSISQADLWQLDQNQHDAINGVGGGTWAPSSQIVIGGQGIYMSGPLEVSATFATYGDTFIGSDAADSMVVSAESTFNATATFNSEVTANGDVTLGDGAGSTIAIGGAGGADSLGVNAKTDFYQTITSTSDLVIAGNAQLGSTASDHLQVYATSTFASGIDVPNSFSLGAAATDYGYVNGNTSFYGTADYYATATFGAPVTVSALATFSGAATFTATVTLGNATTDTVQCTGNLRLSRTTITLSTDGTLTDTGSQIMIVGSTSGANRNIVSTGAPADGALKIIKNLDPNWTIFLKNADTTQFGSISPVGAAIIAGDGSVWHQIF